MINEHFFNITRASANPLISTLTVTNVVAGLSATKVYCTEIESSLADASTSMATINVINPGLSRLIKMGIWFSSLQTQTQTSMQLHY